MSTTSQRQIVICILTHLPLRTTHRAMQNMRVLQGCIGFHAPARWRYGAPVSLVVQVGAEIPSCITKQTLLWGEMGIVCLISTTSLMRYAPLDHFYRIVGVHLIVRYYHIPPQKSIPLRKRMGAGPV